VYGLLERMFHDKFLSPADVAAFESRLLPHQKATDATGTTVMQRAMVEHNMLAASKVGRQGAPRCLRAQRCDALPYCSALGLLPTHIPLSPRSPPHRYTRTFVCPPSRLCSA
jgi:hypothetical protein